MAGVTREQARLSRRSMPMPWSGCWIWMGSVTRDGYGHLPFRGRYMGAHRASYLAFSGVIPEGQDVCHQCDVKLCINPQHLFAGSRQDNMRDWTKKTGGKRGEKHHLAKLTAFDVLAIRADTRPRRIVANAFDVHPKSIDRIRRRGTWRHL